MTFLRVPVRDVRVVMLGLLLIVSGNGVAVVTETHRKRLGESRERVRRVSRPADGLDPQAGALGGGPRDDQNNRNDPDYGPLKAIGLPHGEQ